MARKGKWVNVASPNEPVVEAARRALEDRLALVWHYLQQASRGIPADTISVHQLRVSTRRAVAALRLFATLLPDGRRDWMLRQLKRIRRAAGAARDLDVMIERFAAPTGNEPHDDAQRLLLTHLRSRREQAQRPIEAIHRKLARRTFRKRARQLRQRVKLRTAEDLRDAPTFFDAARLAIESRVQTFFQAGDVDFTNDTLLHAFRIRGKQLRYAMEIFAGGFDPAFKRELYPLVVELQDRLGRINDHATASARFAEWMIEPECSDRVRRLLESLVEQEQQQLEQCRAEFIAWWTAERREELQRRFTASLAGQSPL